MTHWTEKYMRIPFKEGGRSFAGCDCGGLALLVLREEKGVLAADFTEYNAADFRQRLGFARLGKGIDELMREWVVVERPRPFDLCRFRYAGVPCHVGIYIGPCGFLHCERKINTAVTRHNDPHWSANFIEFRRHRELL